ncbi:MAG: hypothetical protein ABIL25_07630 [candidate division WOR-3 bacterium]
MGKKKRPLPPSGPPLGPKEELSRIVAGLDCPEEQRPFYLTFAWELYHTLRQPPVPGFSHYTQRVVLKWFHRGLSGRLLWHIGQQIVRWRFSSEAGHGKND